MSIITFSQSIGPVQLPCILTERHISDVEITRYPIETGAEINDHAYVKPKELTIELVDMDAAIAYEELIRFQESRVPFTIVTGFTVYYDMLIDSVIVDRDKDKSAIMHAKINMREVHIVSTASVDVDTATSLRSNTTKPGSPKSRRSVVPSAETANNTETADRVAAPVREGDNPANIVPDKESISILDRVFN